MKIKMFGGASHFIFENAKALRNNPTDAERIVWDYLRQRPYKLKFRRQHPISIYIADFYCHSLKLIIEIDGNIHAEEEVLRNDIKRQKDLEADGLTFLRFTNEQVKKNLEEVISVIENYIITNKQQL